VHQLVGRGRRIERAARGSAGRGAALLRACLLFAVLFAACGPASVYTSFDPAAPCTTDGRFPGAYPALEARLPKTFLGRAPDTVDSGRNCTAAELGTLAGHGIREVRFAGASWFLSGNAGVTLAMFTGDGLTAEWLGEWYESTARAARNTRQIDPTRPTIAGAQAYRLDTLNGESHQTVIDWTPAGGDAVYVVVAADASTAAIDAATAAFPTDR
jgi:hypothetical protein